MENHDDLIAIGLTKEQLDFAIGYAKHANGAKAAREAGYSRHTAKIRASKLLRNPKVKQAVDLIRERIPVELRPVEPDEYPYTIQRSPTESEMQGKDVTAEMTRGFQTNSPWKYVPKPDAPRRPKPKPNKNAYGCPLNDGGLNADDVSGVYSWEGLQALVSSIGGSRNPF